jgi:hypothetical protein
MPDAGASRKRQIRRRSIREPIDVSRRHGALQAPLDEIEAARVADIRRSSRMEIARSDLGPRSSVVAAKIRILITFCVRLCRCKTDRICTIGGTTAVPFVDIVAQEDRLASLDSVVSRCLTR